MSIIQSGAREAASNHGAPPAIGNRPLSKLGVELILTEVTAAIGANRRAQERECQAALSWVPDEGHVNAGPNRNSNGSWAKRGENRSRSAQTAKEQQKHSVKNGDV
jgi:hypothetical protein